MTALDAVRPAIETFYTALNDEQKARLVARLMSSMWKALRIWAQPSRMIAMTSTASIAGSNAVLIESGRVVTRLSARNAARILVRIRSMKRTNP